MGLGERVLRWEGIGLRGVLGLEGVVGEGRESIDAGLDGRSGAVMW